MHIHFKYKCVFGGLVGILSLTALFSLSCAQERGLQGQEQTRSFADSLVLLHQPFLPGSNLPGSKLPKVIRSSASETHLSFDCRTLTKNSSTLEEKTKLLIELAELERELSKNNTTLTPDMRQMKKKQAQCIKEYLQKMNTEGKEQTSKTPHP